MLKGIKVLELGNNISAPLVGQILADLGSEVIKVEPLTGDERRKIKPEIDGVGVYFASTNRGKKSIAINLKSEEGYNIFKRLVANANVLITNYRPSALKRLKIDYENVLKMNSKIIYCSITGFGNYSPEAEKPAYDAVILALSGLMDMTGEENGPPVKFATSISDITTALLATIAILAALHHGGPEFIDVPMLQSQFYLTLEDAYMYLNTGLIPKRMGSSHRYIVPYQVFKTSDGYIFLGVFTDKQYSNLCKALNREDLLKFDTLSKRLENREYISNELQKIFISNSREYWVDLLTKYDIPVAPVLNLGEAFNKYGKELVYEISGIKYMEFPINFEKYPKDNYKLKAPRLGEHTKEILLKLGFNETEIKELADKNIIFMQNN